MIRLGSATVTIHAFQRLLRLCLGSSGTFASCVQKLTQFFKSGPDRLRRNLPSLQCDYQRFCARLYPDIEVNQTVPVLIGQSATEIGH